MNELKYYQSDDSEAIKFLYIAPDHL